MLAARETELLRESEEQLQRLYRETPLPLHVVGADGRIEKVSDTWLHLLGHTRAEVSGRSLTDFMTEELRGQYHRIVLPSLQRGEEAEGGRAAVVGIRGEAPRRCVVGAPGARGRQAGAQRSAG